MYSYLRALSGCQRILLVGAGGGFDIFAGLPLARYLRDLGKQVFLANLSFSRMPDGSRLPGLLEVRPDTFVDCANFPELYLARFYDSPVYCFASDGVLGVLEHYRQLSARLDLDALVLVDGGTDSLLRGDEPGLGTPGEDMASLGAAHLLNLPVKLLLCLGFGVDTHHHVCHHYVLEAAAELTAGGDFLGAFSLLPHEPEFQELAAALAFVGANMEGKTSIVTTSVVAAGEGKFGDFHASERTRGSKLFVNPLMSMYWCFHVDGLARRCMYLEPLLRTRTRGDVTQVVQAFRSSITPRPWVSLPM